MIFNMKKFLDALTYIGLFAFGIWFYSAVLDKPETVNKIKRLKQKKGAGNEMYVEVGESPSDKRKKQRKAKKQKRKNKKQNNL